MPARKRLFGRVGVVNVRWSVLEFCLFAGNKLLNVFWGFIVHSVEPWLVASAGKKCIGAFVGVREFLLGSFFNWDRLEGERRKRSQHKHGLC